MFTLHIQKNGKALNSGRVKALGNNLFHPFVPMKNANNSGKWTCEVDFPKAAIFVDGKCIGTYHCNDRIALE